MKICLWKIIYLIEKKETGKLFFQQTIRLCMKETVMEISIVFLHACPSVYLCVCV